MTRANLRKQMRHSGSPFCLKPSHMTSVWWFPFVSFDFFLANCHLLNFRVFNFHPRYYKRMLMKYSIGKQRSPFGLQSHPKYSRNPPTPSGSTGCEIDSRGVPPPLLLIRVGRVVDRWCSKASPKNLPFFRITQNQQKCNYQSALGRPGSTFGVFVSRDVSFFQIMGQMWNKRRV